ncbi:MAG: uracil phosphoribosyltransferase [Aeropyrum sp.]|nr:uracil phosphoribosyltransferase [Aeropyrum sp.]
MTAIPGVHVVGGDTPLARYILRVLRDRKTGFEDFRRAMRIAGSILAVFASRELDWKPVEVETPLDVRAVELEPASPVYLVGVLGASIPLVEGFASAIPGSRIALVAARRLEEPGRISIEVYYSRLPKRFDGPAIIIDPMLATGKTVAEAVKLAKSRGAERVVVASVISSRPGVDSLRRLYPDVPIYTLALDPELDENYFIVPGLGDAGDRALGVEP